LKALGHPQALKLGRNLFYFAIHVFPSVDRLLHCRSSFFVDAPDCLDCPQRGALANRSDVVLRQRHFWHQHVDDRVAALAARVGGLHLGESTRNL
jgi:hypothetical protein